MAAAGPGGWGDAQLGGQEDTQSENTWPLGQTRPGEREKVVELKDRAGAFTYFSIMCTLQMKS